MRRHAVYVNVPKSRFIIGSQLLAPSTGTLRSMWSLKNRRSSSVTYLYHEQANSREPVRHSGPVRVRAAGKRQG
jgi:hypothetical protein